MAERFTIAASPLKA